METYTTNPLIKFLVITAFTCAAGLFFFDFYTVTIDETAGNPISGIGIIRGNNLLNASQKKNIDAYQLSNLQHFSTGVWAIIALACAAGGIFSSISETGSTIFTGILAGTIGAASLIILKSVVTAAYKSSIRLPGIATTFEFAYWAAVLSFIVAACVCYTRLSQKINSPPKEKSKKNKVIGSLSFPFIENKN